jgi:hypothetical protein
MVNEQFAYPSDYFKSIEHSFEETLAGQKQTNLLAPLGMASIFLLVFSVIPLVPLILTHLVPWALKSTSVTIKGVRVPLDSMWIWWLTASGILLGISVLIFRWDGEREKRNKKKWISEPQLRFALCYAIAEEIEKYQTNGIQKHADLAYDYWHQLQGMLFRFLRPFGAFYPHAVAVPTPEAAGAEFWPKHPFVPYPEINALKTQFSWFRLDAKTNSVIEMFTSLPDIVHDRLRDRKDLDQVRGCLTLLAGYLYTRIPDIPERNGPDSLSDVAEASLGSLTSAIANLPAYSSEPKPISHPTHFWKEFASTTGQFAAPFAHPNILVCFVAWYIFTLLLTLGALKVAFHFLPKMTVDTILVSVIVGGPLACAVSAVALSRSRKSDRPVSTEEEK